MMTKMRMLKTSSNWSSLDKADGLFGSLAILLGTKGNKDDEVEITSTDCKDSASEDTMDQTTSKSVDMSSDPTYVNSDHTPQLSAKMEVQEQEENEEEQQQEDEEAAVKQQQQAGSSSTAAVRYHFIVAPATPYVHSDHIDLAVAKWTDSFECGQKHILNKMIRVRMPKRQPMDLAEKEYNSRQNDRL